MSSARFDILFAGETLPGADPAEVRRRVQALFKVSDEAAERLFSGAPIAVKRAVDAETSRRFDALFREAGALVRIAPVAAPSEPAMAPATPAPTAVAAPQALDPAPVRSPQPGPLLEGEGDAARAAREAPDSATPLGLAPPGDAPLEPPVSQVPPPLDLSDLSLVEGEWTLADCVPPPPPVAVPDISRLRLAPVDEAEAHESRP